MTILKWLLLLAGLGYAGLVALLYAGQRSLLYFPDRTRISPAAAGLPEAEEVELKTADGERVVAWHVPPRGEKPVVLYFPGNGGNLGWRAERFRSLTSDGIGLVGLDYRGYGRSSGQPSEAGLLRDAVAAYDFAAARYSATRIALWGESLGTGVAVATAAEHPVARLVLESPFTSVADVAASIYWFAPVKLLLKDTFRSDARIARVTAPVLVIHGGRDSVTPIRFGERLYEMIRASKSFLRLPDADHNDHDAYGAVDAVRAFVEDTSEGSVG